MVLWGCPAPRGYLSVSSVPPEEQGIKGPVRQPPGGPLVGPAQPPVHLPNEGEGLLPQRVRDRAPVPVPGPGPLCPSRWLPPLPMCLPRRCRAPPPSPPRPSAPAPLSARRELAGAGVVGVGGGRARRRQGRCCRGGGGGGGGGGCGAPASVGCRGGCTSPAARPVAGALCSPPPSLRPALPTRLPCPVPSVPWGPRRPCPCPFLSGWDAGSFFFVVCVCMFRCPFSRCAAVPGLVLPVLAGWSPRASSGVLSSVPSGGGVWPPLVVLAGALVAVGCFRAPAPSPLCFFLGGGGGGGGAACSSLCLPWLAHALARIQCCLPRCCWRLRFVWPCSGPMGRMGYVHGGLGAPSCRVSSWLCRLGGCARGLLVALG